MIDLPTGGCGRRTHWSEDRIGAYLFLLRALSCARAQSFSLRTYLRASSQFELSNKFTKKNTKLKNPVNRFRSIATTFYYYYYYQWIGSRWRYVHKWRCTRQHDVHFCFLFRQTQWHFCDDQWPLTSASCGHRWTEHTVVQSTQCDEAIERSAASPAQRREAQTKVNQFKWSRSWRAV